MNGWIGVDLDGTLAEYHGWVDEVTIGKPIPLMVERVKTWLSEGKDVRVFTARVYGEPNGHEYYQIRVAIEKWCKLNIGVVLPITCEKDYGMIMLYDDRCVQVETNTGKLIERGS